MEQGIDIENPYPEAGRATALLSESYLDIFLSQDHGYIHAVWKGYQSVESIEEGCERILTLMKAHGIQLILNDHAKVLGIWRFAAEWMAKQWFPRMQRAGLKHFAWVVSPAKLSQVSTDTTLEMLDARSYGIETFHDLGAAHQWLVQGRRKPRSRNGRRIKVLAIEDNRDFSQLFRDMLEIMGCDAATVPTAQAGLDAAKAQQPDIIFCDIGLPGSMDGFGFARAMRADPALSHIPLIAVSGYASDDNRLRAAHAGFDRVLAKPVKFADVSHTLDTIEHMKRDA